METTENQLYKNVEETIRINLREMVVTYKIASRLLLTVIEYLSYNRNQIPMIYEIFEYMAKKLEKYLKEKSGAPSENRIKSFALDRQREVVVKTNQSFRDISKVSNDKCECTLHGYQPITYFSKAVNVNELLLDAFLM